MNTLKIITYVENLLDTESILFNVERFRPLVIVIG